MNKNVANQTIGAQMLTTAFAEFSGTVTVYITGDGGTQTLGTVGSGVCTNKGHGYYLYQPSQAETNFNLIGFTFIGTGAITQTIQVPTSIQTGDAYARLGAPAGASVSADIAAVTSDVLAIPTTVLTESYNADGSAPTIAQALLVIMQMLTEMSISGTTVTIKKLDGSTTAFTLMTNDATSPTSITRTS
jgi:hypothetical protein